MKIHYHKPTEEFGTPDELLQWANEEKKGKQVRRYLFIRALMQENAYLKDVAHIFGISVRTGERWIEKWNKGGKEELKIKPQPGCPKKFKDEHAQKVTELIENQYGKEDTRLTIKGVHGFLKG